MSKRACINSENCRTYSDAQQLLFNARLYLQSTAAKNAIPPNYRPFFDALRLLTEVHQRVLEAWAAQAAEMSGGAGSKAA